MSNDKQEALARASEEETNRAIDESRAKHEHGYCPVILIGKNGEQYVGDHRLFYGRGRRGR